MTAEHGIKCIHEIMLNVSSGRLLVCRLVEIISNKIFNVQKDDAQLECINNAPTKLYRVEEIPKDELNLAEDELIVQVAHFNKV